VEGYLESAAMGLWAGLNLGLRLNGRTPSPPPPETAVGALLSHIGGVSGAKFEPMNMNFGLLPPLGQRMRDKAKAKRARAERALAALENWIDAEGGTVRPG
jgi:methylenetetrahydrofolate--tRNA-(uracil-5-)-methyltransferase